MQSIDLHIHSTLSDGSYTPEQIICYAKEKGLCAIALTDHDSIEGITRCQTLGNKLGIKVIPGIELSASYNGLEVHILGYNIDIYNTSFLKSLEEIACDRYLRNELIIEKLNSLNLDIKHSDLYDGKESHKRLTRAHFANALLKKGYISYSKEAFDRYLGYGKPAYVDKKLVSTQRCIELIHDAGGVAVLAHPTLYRLNKVRIYNLIYALMKEGLDGIECIYPSYTPTQTKDFLQLCQKNHLISTGGSDFHGDYKPKLDLGIGYGTLNVPRSFLEPFNLLGII